MQKLIKWCYSKPFVAKYGFKMFVFWLGVKSELKRWFCRHRSVKTIWVDVQDRFAREQCNDCGKDLYSEC
jgi:hypothetical protein